LGDGVVLDAGCKLKRGNFAQAFSQAWESIAVMSGVGDV
jgi:hypothetical protein